MCVGGRGTRGAKQGNGRGKGYINRSINVTLTYPSEAKRGDLFTLLFTKVRTIKKPYPTLFI